MEHKTAGARCRSTGLLTLSSTGSAGATRKTVADGIRHCDDGVHRNTVHDDLKEFVIPTHHLKADEGAHVECPHQHDDDDRIEVLADEGDPFQLPANAEEIEQRVDDPDCCACE